MSDSPTDKAIKKSAENTEFEAFRPKSELLGRDSDLFEAILYRIEDDLGYTARDWDKVNIYLYPNRDDVLVNCYEIVPPPDGVLPIFPEYRIQSFRALLSGDDDQVPDDQVLKVERT